MMMNTNECKTNELLAMLVGSDTAKALARKPLTEVFGFSTPRQMSLNEEVATYHVHPVLAAAKELIARCYREEMAKGICFPCPSSVKEYLSATIGHLEYEVFWCLYLDSQNRLISAEECFRGTLNQTSVHARELVKRALKLNAGAVMFAHNHPSGITDPSRADEVLTRTLKQALNLVDTKVLDHFVVSGASVLSFAEQGLL